MVEIGGKPILWHIMKIYSSYGINEFVICLGYKGYFVKEYFANYVRHTSDLTIDMSKDTIEVMSPKHENWKVILADTGDDTMTGGRIKKIRDYIGPDETFLLTYGDGVSNVNINDLIAFHKKTKALCTLTAVQPPGRFGSVKWDGDRVASFAEKPQGDGAWINGGFFVCEPAIFDYIDGPATTWEQEPMMNLARDNKMAGYKFDGFWHPMDTLRDKNHLEQLWSSGKAPWKTW
jgi:glucose-1-phosphate cytidylyltransferase